jgi:hypothetical protein
MEELKHKFREVFKPLKTNVGQKIFSDYVDIGLTGIVCLHWLRANFSRLDHWGIGLGSNFGQMRKIRLRKILILKKPRIRIFKPTKSLVSRFTRVLQRAKI